MIRPRILLGILTYKYVTSMCYCNHMSTLLDGINCGLVKNLSIEADMYVTIARNNLCLAALDLQKKDGITHLLMIDDDMVIPEGSIEKLASNDLPIVGGAYYTRGGDSIKPVAYNLDPFEMLDYVPDSGVIPVDGTGGGFLLISCDLLGAMRDRYKDPWWFQNSTMIENGKEKYIGEDVFLFKRLKEMGIQAYLDCNVQLGHAGTAISDRKVFEISRGAGFRESWCK